MDKRFERLDLTTIPVVSFSCASTSMREHNLDGPNLVLSPSRVQDFRTCLTIAFTPQRWLREGQLLEAGGDPSASQKYWEVANFAQRMKLGDGQESLSDGSPCR